MMKMKTLITIGLIICIISGNLYSQSKKKVKNLGIESVTVVKEDYEDSNGKEILRSETVFDENGNIIKLKDYDKTGKLREIVTYEYNSDNDKIKEVRYRPNNKVDETITYSYENGIITERCKYDASNRLLSKKKYIYKFKDN